MSVHKTIRLDDDIAEFVHREMVRTGANCTRVICRLARKGMKAEKAERERDDDQG